MKAHVGVDSKSNFQSGTRERVIATRHYQTDGIVKGLHLRSQRHMRRLRKVSTEHFLERCDDSVEAQRSLVLVLQAQSAFWHSDNTHWDFH
jgi:lactam utilization protein B